MQPQQTGVGQGTPGACTRNLVQMLADNHPQVKSVWEPWPGLTVHPPDCVLSFVEVVNRGKDKPLPLQPSDLSGTTFVSFSLKRIFLKKKEVEKRQINKSTLHLCSLLFPWFGQATSGFCGMWGGEGASGFGFERWLMFRAFFPHPGCWLRGWAARPLTAWCFLSRVLWHLHTEAGSQRQMFQKFDRRAVFFAPWCVWRKC